MGLLVSAISFVGFPDETNTGVSEGASLTVVNGDQTYNSSFNGQTISEKDFHGLVTVTGADITFRDCIFRGKSVVEPQNNNGCINTVGSTGTIYLEDIEVDPEFPTVKADGMWLSNTEVYRANIHGGVDGVKTFSNVLIEDSYIHDMHWYASDPSQGGSASHNDGVQSSGGTVNTTLTHNNIDMSTVVNILGGGGDINAANAAWQCSSSNARAERNLLDGGNCVLNFDLSSVSDPVYVISNRFGRNSIFECPILISTTTAITENTGNVWDDTGLPIPPPDQHD